eukprot:1150765-Pelagomonas_calceolata.AAC.5
MLTCSSARLRLLLPKDSGPPGTLRLLFPEDSGSPGTYRQQALSQVSLVGSVALLGGTESKLLSWLVHLQAAPAVT